MNIRYFYHLKGQVFLNECLASFIPALIFLPALLKAGKGLLLLPFLFMGVYSFHKFLLYEIRSDKSLSSASPKQKEDGFSLFEQNRLLAAFLPAPSLRMCFFHKDGSFSGEIRDVVYQRFRWFLPFWLDKKLAGTYGLYVTKNGTPQFFFLKMKKTIIVTNRDGRPLIHLKQRTKQQEWKILMEGAFGGKKRGNPSSRPSIFVQAGLFGGDVKFLDEKGDMLARFRKGWMPLEWDAVFQDPNMPVLSFNEGLGFFEKLAVFAILIFLFQYHEH